MLMKPLSRVTAIDKKGVMAINPDSGESFYKADTVAVTLGFEQNLELADQLRNIVPELKVVGDCIEPRRMADATKKGYLAANEI